MILLCLYIDIAQLGIIVAVVAALLLVAVLWVTLVPRLIRRQRKERLGDRKLISVDDFYEAYYRSTAIPRELVGELLHGVAAALELPPGLLRPTDRFSVEFGPLPGWGALDDRLDFYDYLIAIERKYDFKLDRDKIKTLDDLIRAIGERPL